MVVVVTGCAGFIGSALVDRLLAQGHRITGVDNFSTGQRRFLESALRHPRFRLIEGDILDNKGLTEWFRGADCVMHLAANADVRFGTEHPRRDLELNTIATHNVLEAMRINGVKHILFTSTGSVYGEATVIPTPENAPFPVQTSLYGASKLAGEGLVAAYAEGCGIATTVFRFVSILGPRYTHGHVTDFMRQLLEDPAHLVILGDGKQRKSYLDVTDCVAAIVSVLDRSEGHEVYNLGVESYCTVDESASWICERLGVRPEVTYTGGDRGWVGDNPFVYLATDKMRATGWKPAYTIREAVERTVDYLRDNTWILKRPELRT